MSKEIGIYVHIPFCANRCPYCDFNVSIERRGVEGRYLDALLKEAKHWGERLAEAGRVAETLYLGGGTPTWLEAADLLNLLEGLKSALPLKADAEISIEGNPGTITQAKCEAMRAGGVNRLSLGAQSFDPQVLRSLGRIHSAEDIRSSFEIARVAGFSNINLDLIYGVPGQSFASWQNTLTEVVGLRPEHISFYSLTIEPGTAFGRMLREGKLKEMDSDDQAEMYEMAHRCLSHQGYSRYEVSNFALPGFECRHNLIYWENGDFIGLGCGAWSHLDGVRWRNLLPWREYVKVIYAGSLPIELNESLGPSRRAEEVLSLNLRLSSGIDPQRLESIAATREQRQLWKQQLQDLLEAGLLTRNNGKVQLSDQGFLLANEVFIRFFQ